MSKPLVESPCWTGEIDPGAANDFYLCAQTALAGIKDGARLDLPDINERGFVAQQVGLRRAGQDSIVMHWLTSRLHPKRLDLKMTDAGATSTSYGENSTMVSTAETRFAMHMLAHYAAKGVVASPFGD